MLPQSNKIHINNLPFEYARASELHIMRGWQPFEWKFLVTDPSRWRALKNPLSIRFITPDEGGAKRVFKLERWYITSIEPHSSKMWEVTLQDMRWALLNKSFVGGWNIETPDGETRGERKTASQRYFVSCYQAAVEALDLLGESGVIDDRGVELPTIQLPKNLGDSEAGGYVAGTLKDIDLFLEFGRMDMVPSKDGKLIITDRFTDKTAGLSDAPSFAGFTDNRDIHWKKPKKIITTYEQLVERPFDVQLGSQATSVGTPVTDMALVNVAPGFDINTVPQLREDGSEIINWLPIDRDPTSGASYLLTYLHQSYSEFLARFMKPTGIPMSPGQTRAYKEAVFLERRYEQIARSSLYTTWKVDFNKTGVGRNWMRVRLGRLGSKGVNLPGAHVFCDYFEYTTLSVDNKNGVPSENIHAKNHPYNPAVPSPMDSTWLSDGQHDLVFKLHPVLRGNGVTILTPGLITPEVLIGDPQDVANGADNKTGDQCRIVDSFKMRVFWNALMASRIGRHERLHSVENVAFADGAVEDITIHVKNTTANWGYQEGVEFPGVLLNKFEIRDRARVVTEQVMETFRTAKSGVITASGCKHLEKHWVGGNIYGLVIQIGLKSEFSIDSQFIVLPEVRGPVVSSGKDLDGVKPGVIG